MDLRVIRIQSHDRIGLVLRERGKVNDHKEITLFFD